MLRPDQIAVTNLIAENTRVFDIGCGEGILLDHLKQSKNIYAHGLELDGHKVANAVGKGLSVVQGNGDSDLSAYPDKSFDIVSCVLTLQAMNAPKDALAECLRIGKQVIVVIPNFGNIKNRLYLGLKGKMPVTKTLSYQWYETPNIHFCTILDFINLAQELDANINKSIAVSKSGKTKNFNYKCPMKANLLADKAVFLLASD